MRYFRYLRNVIGYLDLPRGMRRLTFYSEGRNYWTYLEPLVTGVLSMSDVPVCYISSDEKDPGLKLEDPQCMKFVIDEKHIRDWLFKNMETDILVMTMPDLHQYQVKRSRHQVHYVYVQHSLVSLHMVYNKGAFDHFDTIFCAGPHHVKEVRAMEEKYNLRRKKLVRHGYGRLDVILRESRNYAEKRLRADSRRHILVAPSWGKKGMIESGIGESVIGHLLRETYRVTFRPHPQTVKFAKHMVRSILERHEKNPLFAHELDMENQDSLHDSDAMISDWSGVALEYLLALNKPVLYVDVPRKVNNEEYGRIVPEPLECRLRKTGRSDVLKVQQIHRVSEKIEDLLKQSMNGKFEHSQMVFNPGESGTFGASRLLEMLKEIERAGTSTR